MRIVLLVLASLSFAPVAIGQALRPSGFCGRNILASSVNPLDVANTGDGFFATTFKGRRVYTRDGRLRLDKQGRLVLASSGGPIFGLSGTGLVIVGVPLLSARHFHGLSIDNRGVLSGVNAKGVTHIFGQVALAAFPHPDLLRFDRRGFAWATQASGDPRIGEPGTDGRGILQSGYVELGSTTSP